MCGLIRKGTLPHVYRHASSQSGTKAEGDEDSLNDIRYYLHLPKIAYTLARLPDKVRNNEGFRPVMTSLKNPYNAPYFRAIATWIEYLNRRSNSQDL